MAEHTWKRWILKDSEGKFLVNRFEISETELPITAYRSKRAAQEIADMLPGTCPVRVAIRIEEL